MTQANFSFHCSSRGEGVRDQVAEDHGSHHAAKSAADNDAAPAVDLSAKSRAN